MLFCKDCGWEGKKPKRMTRGSFFIELFLWLMIIIPGIVYSLWRQTTKTDICPDCKSENLIPASSRMATQAKQSMGIHAVSP